MAGRNRSATQIDAQAIRRERTWEFNYLRLKRLVIAHPETFRKSADPGLIRWFMAQRRAFKSGAFPYNLAIKVMELDGFYSESVSRWQKGFDRLLAFRGANPDQWPRQDEALPDGFFLGKWCWRQRRDYRQGTLKQDRLDRLRELGFPLDKGLQTEGWYQQYRQLQSFRKSNPDRWPYLSEFFPPGNNLGNWFGNQTRAYAKGILATEKLKALNQLGTDWKTGKTRYQDNWKEWYGRLAVFRRRHPDRWPGRNARDEAEDKLAQWCYFQRLWRKRGTLSPERVRRLLEIGFPFDLKRSAWLRQLQDLQQWRRNHPKVWPSGRSENKAEVRLANWLYQQRAQKRSGEMPGENIRLLSQMGFPWKGKN